MQTRNYLKISLSSLLLIYPIIELVISIYLRQDIVDYTNYSVNISDWLIIKDVFVLLNTCILISYFLSKRINVLTYCISQCIVYLFNIFTFIWISIGIIIYANQFQLGDFDTPIVIVGVLGGYFSLYNLYRINNIISDIIDDNRKTPAFAKA